jgi:hypothetical protein
MIESTDYFYELLLDLCAVEDEIIKISKKPEEHGGLEVTMEMAV